MNRIILAPPLYSKYSLFNSRKIKELVKSSISLDADYNECITVVTTPHIGICLVSSKDKNSICE